ncbi:hypothetical protein [Nostoc sp. MG11]|nr:hypothetical protein [Nostoc sp. MG11]
MVSKIFNRQEVEGDRTFYSEYLKCVDALRLARGITFIYATTIALKCI